MDARNQISAITSLPRPPPREIHMYPPHPHLKPCFSENCRWWRPGVGWVPPRVEHGTDWLMDLGKSWVALPYWYI